MLGNWSLGDYFKREAITWSYEFLTGRQWLGFDPDRLYGTVCGGNDRGPPDHEAANLWMEAGIPRERIHFLGMEDNWWGPAGKTGPCGPDTEMFYDTGKEPCGGGCRPGCSCGKYFEVWNDVFMQYRKTASGTYEPLGMRSVDTGDGGERRDRRNASGPRQRVRNHRVTGTFSAPSGRWPGSQGRNPTANACAA
jgi:alanyl-tRNA synthetase